MMKTVLNFFFFRRLGYCLVQIQTGKILQLPRPYGDFKYTVLCDVFRTPRSIHRNRINTEEKAKVVTAVWETEFIQFLAIVRKDDLNNRMN